MTGCVLDVLRMQSLDVTSMGEVIIAGEMAGALSGASPDSFGVLDTQLIYPVSGRQKVCDTGYRTDSGLYPTLKGFFEASGKC